MKVPSKKVSANIVVHEFHKVNEIVEGFSCHIAINPNRKEVE